MPRATALFYCRFPTSLDVLPAWSIAWLDLGKPIIDFVVSHDGLVWVLVDGEWQSEPSDTEIQQDANRLVRLLKWVDGKVFLFSYLCVHGNSDVC